VLDFVLTFNITCSGLLRKVSTPSKYFYLAWLGVASKIISGGSPNLKQFTSNISIWLFRFW